MDVQSILQQASQHPDAIIVPESWSQGRAVYGGLVAAILLQGMREQVGPSRSLRSLSLTFVGPMQTQQPASLSVECYREGRAVSQMGARLLQQGQVVAIMQGSFGEPRDSQVRVASGVAPSMTAVEQCREIPHIPGVTPEFLQHIAIRWGKGGLPFAGQGEAIQGGWLRLRERGEDRPMGEADLLALADGWPVPLITYLDRPAPASSMTWTIEFVQPSPALRRDDWVLYQAQIQQAADGYGSAAATLWTPAGELLAISRQMVMVFA